VSRHPFHFHTVALALLAGFLITIALSWLAMPLPGGNAWHGPRTVRELGLAAAPEGELYQITCGTNGWHTTVAYWRMQVSGMPLMIPTADYDARRFDYRRLPSHLRPASLAGLSMQAWYHATGWPFRALACSVHWERQIANANVTYTVRGGVQIPRDAAFNPRALPLTPIWLGLLADTLLFAAVWLALASGVRAARRRRRIRCNLCAACRYPRHALPPGAPCPECGAHA
jgi:hypothetical protein